MSFRKFISTAFLSIGVAPLTTTGCAQLNKGAQLAFTSDHYEALEIYGSATAKNSDNNADLNPDTAGIVFSSKGNELFLNTNNEDVQAFRNGGQLTNDKFVAVAYEFIRVADTKCFNRQGDITQGSMAMDSGFGMLTTTSSLVATAIGSQDTSRWAAGAATLFNSVSSNGSAIQEHMEDSYSLNVVRGMDAARNSSQTRIQQKLIALMKKSENTDFAVQSHLRFLLTEYNRACTIGAGQKAVTQKVVAATLPAAPPQPQIGNGQDDQRMASLLIEALQDLPDEDLDRFIQIASALSSD